MGKKWIYCYGLKANESYWSEMWSRFKATYDNRYLEYLTCTKNHAIICEYLSQMINSNIHLDINTRATVIFRIIAKHANKDEVLSCIFENIANTTLSSNRYNK